MTTIPIAPQPQYNAAVTIAYGGELAQLHQSLWELPGDKYMWIYTLDIDYLGNLLTLARRPHDVYALVDYRTRHHAAHLAHLNPRFKPRAWSWNRTMHAKGLIVPSANLLWLTSANCNEGSHLHGRNIAALTASVEATQQALAIWCDAWQHSTPIAPSREPPTTLAKLK